VSLESELKKLGHSPKCWCREDHGCDPCKCCGMARHEWEVGEGHCMGCGQARAEWLWGTMVQNEEAL
jgi:hypothetical protein